MEDSKRFLDNPTARNFFGVVFRRRTYFSLFYLLLSFPLGVMYFVFLVTAFSIGIGLSFILVGIPVLLATLAFSRILGRFEIAQAEAFTGVEIGQFEGIQGGDLMSRVRRMLLDAATWKSVLLLLIKFPIGIFAFVVLTTLGTLSFVLLAAPFLYQVEGVSYNLGFMTVNSLPAAALMSLFGIAVLFGSLHLLNGLARGEGGLVRLLLREAE